MPQDFLIEAEDLSRHYGERRAVDGLGLTVRRGEVLGLLGPNGAGKSTTLQMLSGNLAPGTGEIRINGIDLLSRPRIAKRDIGYLPDRPPLYPELTLRARDLRAAADRKSFQGLLPACRNRAGHRASARSHHP
jgi:ABC-2 type transport system ATP-binding protein